MENNKNPNIRFKGFTDPWEQRKLGELVEIGDIDHRMPETVADGIPYLMTGDFVGTNELNFDGTKMISEEDYCQLSQKIKPEKGDILFARYASVGAARYVDFTRKFLISYSCAIIKKSKKINSKYLYHFITSDNAQQQIKLEINTGSQANIGISSMKNHIVVSMPPLGEQTKIADALSNLDHLITLHQRKYNKLLNVKKSMLEKMFPKNGSNIPEIRFKGFTDPWEQRKLGDIITEYKETVDSDCTLPILTSSKTEGVILQEEHFGRKQQHDITGYNILPRNYCTYRNRSDGVDFTFNINKCCDKGIISKFYPVFSGKNSDVFFLSLVLNNSEEVVREIAYTCTGTGQKVLSFLDLQKMKVRVPNFDEQKEIAAYFDSFDHLITLHQRELEKLQNIKKSMLEKMFV